MAFNWVRDHYPYDQLIREFPPKGWVHVSYAGPGGRGSLLLAKLVVGAWTQRTRTVYEPITEAVA